MCKFQKPTVPSGATVEERKSIYFDALNSLDLSDKIEKRDNLTYLSWANAWAEFKGAYPNATYKIIKNPATNLPYFADQDLGIIVYTEVTVDDQTHEMWLPVLNGANKPLKFQAYTYSVWDKEKRQYVEKTVNAATMFDVNKAIMRCLVKNLAMFGLGLYIYAGEDLPDTTNAETASLEQKPVTARKRKVSVIPSPMPYADLRNSLQACTSQAELMELYLEHSSDVASNQEIKQLFTNRKNELLNAA